MRISVFVEAIQQRLYRELDGPLGMTRQGLAMAREASLSTSIHRMRKVQ